MLAGRRESGHRTYLGKTAQSTPIDNMYDTFWHLWMIFLENLNLITGRAGSLTFVVEIIGNTGMGDFQADLRFG